MNFFLRRVQSNNKLFDHESRLVLYISIACEVTKDGIILQILR